MQGVGGSGIDLGAERDQFRRLGRTQLENSNKLRGCLQQARAMARLSVGNPGWRRIAEFREQKMNIVNHAGLPGITKQ